MVMMLLMMMVALVHAFACAMYGIPSEVQQKFHELGELCAHADENVRQSQAILNQSTQDVFVLTNRLGHILQKSQALRGAAQPLGTDHRAWRAPSPLQYAQQQLQQQQAARLALPPLPQTGAPQYGGQVGAPPVPWQQVQQHPPSAFV
eukprot:2838709-Amphidinium_carterae.1